MKTIRIGIVGTGGMAGAHVRFFKKIPGVELTSCFDIDPARAKEFAEKHGFRGVAGNLDQLFDAVDDVSVVASDAAHAPVSLATLAAGKHLFCEKPLTVTIDEARQLARGYAKARQRGVIGMTNFSHRGAHFDKAQQIVARGDLGELRYVRGYYLQDWLCGLTNPGPGQVWRLASRPGAGGTLGDLGCHLIDFVTGICGPAKRLRCELRNHRGAAPTTPPPSNSTSPTVRSVIAKRPGGTVDGATRCSWRFTAPRAVWRWATVIRASRSCASAGART
jgi:predicted dehydrogenase